MKRANPPGFTLIEMVASVAILSVILLACGSVLTLATRTTSDLATRTRTQIQAADAAAQVVDDLNVATNFTQRTATAVTFTVPDRLNAGKPQTVSYSWAGAGSPLLRQFNGGTATAILSSAQNISFGYQMRTLGTTVTPPAEVVIASHSTASGTLKDYSLDNKNWGSQTFSAGLLSGISSYSITHARLMLKTGPQSAVMNVSIRTADVLSRPTATILAQTTVYESSFSTAYEWIDIPFTGVTGLNPLTTYCIVVTNAAGSTSIGAVQTDQSLLAILAGSAMSKTANGGSSWSAGDSTLAMRFIIYGTSP